MTEEDRLRDVIRRAIRLLDASDHEGSLGYNALTAQMPAGGVEAERMSERLRDFLQVSIGEQPNGFRGAGDEPLWCDKLCDEVLGPDPIAT